MERCWFVLRQTYFPAPKYKHVSMARGEAEGPVRLGHFISGPKKIDSIINTGDTIPFPPDMRIWHTNAYDFVFTGRTKNALEVSGKASAPIVAAAGMNLSAEAGATFRRIMGSEWSIDQLDVYIVQPTLGYLEQCRELPEMKAWIEKHKMWGTWKVYMITGLMIARGATRSQNRSTETEHGGGPGLDVPTLATFEAKANLVHESETTVAGHFKKDFVWAYRLSEVSKGWFQSDLSHKPVKARGREGTVLAPKTDDVDIDSILVEENVHNALSFEGISGANHEYFVIMDEF